MIQSYEKAPTSKEKSKQQSDNTKTSQKNFTQRLQTVLGRSIGITTANPLVYGIPTFPLTVKDVLSKGHKNYHCDIVCICL